VARSQGPLAAAAKRDVTSFERPEDGVHKSVLVRIEIPAIQEALNRVVHEFRKGKPRAIVEVAQNRQDGNARPYVYTLTLKRIHVVTHHPEVGVIRSSRAHKACTARPTRLTLGPVGAAQ